MINKTDALATKLLNDAIKDKVILFTTPSITNSFYDQCKSRKNVYILDKEPKQYYEGPQRT